MIVRCGACGGRELRPVLNLGWSPPTCQSGTVATLERYPLDLLYCEDCSLTQLSVIVDPAVAFPDDYPYSSGNSRALHENFADLADQAGKAAQLEPGDLVVDIGANDGTLLSKFLGKCRTVGVEPTGQARRIAGPSYQEFFTEELAHRVRDEHGPADVITACNVLAHVANIGSVMRGIVHLLADDGVLVAENHDLASVVYGGQWDTIYHEHLRYYDPYSFNQLLARYGLAARTWMPVPTHGGSFRMFAARGASGYGRPEPRVYDFEALQRAATASRTAIRNMTEGGVVGIGATARATTIINYCDLDHDEIDYVCEVAGSDKIGRDIPGTRIPVVDERVLCDEQPARAILFSWHMADRIVPTLRDRGYQGEIIVPLPVLRVA